MVVLWKMRSDDRTVLTWDGEAICVLSPIRSIILDILIPNKDKWVVAERLRGATQTTANTLHSHIYIIKGIFEEESIPLTIEGQRGRDSLGYKLVDRPIDL